MTIKNLRHRLSRHWVNYTGWKTNRKLVVIESDDWGSVRIPSAKSFKALLNDGINVDQYPWIKVDSLESKDDFSALFEVLKRHSDAKGNYPVITANAVMANPNFDKIIENNFSEYFSEPFPETYRRFADNDRVFDYWLEGINNGFFMPQFHGREHINVKFWMHQLQDASSIFRKAIKHNMADVPPQLTTYPGFNVRASFDALESSEVDEHRQILKEGLDMFEKIFGFRSVSFIANNFIYHRSLDKLLHEQGVKYIQGMTYHKDPLMQSKKRKLIKRSTGKKTGQGQLNTVRNCSFEPVMWKHPQEAVKRCLKDMENAFFWQKPAVITSHRFNYTGSIFENNRRENLRYLDQLLANILKQWPESEFISTPQLGAMIEHAQ